MRLWFFADHLGTPVLITNATGSTVRRRLFEPFGKLVAETELGGYAPPVFFTGKRYEAEAAMYDFGARWYDATTAAFASVDPVIGDLANPLAHNAYSYVLNRAMNLVDPTGAIPEGPAFYFGGFFGFGASVSMQVDMPTIGGDGGGGSKDNRRGAAKKKRLTPRDEDNMRNGRGEWRGAWRTALTAKGARMETRNGKWFVIVPGSGEDAPAEVAARIPASFINGLRDILSATTSSGFEHGGWGHLDGSFSRWDAVARDTMPPTSFTSTTSPDGTRVSTFAGKEIAAHVHAHPRGGIPSIPDGRIASQLAPHGIATMVIQANGSIWVGNASGGFAELAPTSILGGSP